MELKKILQQINKRGYSNYKKLENKKFKISFFEIYFDHIQPDPFAPASRIRIRIPQKIANFPYDTFKNKSREIALKDFLLRNFLKVSKRYSLKLGEGKAGKIYAYTPSQEILDRTCCTINRDFVEFRFFVGLPSRGRRILGNEAEKIFYKFLPEIIEKCFIFENLDKKKLYRWIETNEDADYIRKKLSELSLVAFVADGSILPRRSGIDDTPLESAIPFKSPESLKVKIKVPNRGEITGMGIKKGITLIVGGGFHGKSTLLRAIERGVYNHIPGDGREFIITIKNAIKIRAEDGRSIKGVDISPFIDNLPQGMDTKSFSTDNASGSTSQAANIIEAIEAGAKLLLIDEDTSATNFMIRDERMQRLINKENEPITPFIDKVKLLYKDYDVSTILVMGGSGDYFDVADTVIGMFEYIPKDLTSEKNEIVKEFPLSRKFEGGNEFGIIRKRVPLKRGLNPEKRSGKINIKTKGKNKIIFGKDEIDLTYVEQIVEEGQTRAIAYAIFNILKYIDGKRTLREIFGILKKEMKDKGLESISLYKNPPDLSEFRIIDFAFAFNRIRSLEILVEK